MGKCNCRTCVELKLKRTIDFDPPATAGLQLSRSGVRSCAVYAT